MSITPNIIYLCQNYGEKILAQSVHCKNDYDSACNVVIIVFCS